MLLLLIILFAFAIYYSYSFEQKVVELIEQPCFNRFSGISNDVILQCPIGFEKNPENGAQYQNLSSNKACRRIKNENNPDYFPTIDYCNAHECPNFLAKEKNINPNYLKSPRASTNRTSTSILY